MLNGREYNGRLQSHRRSLRSWSPRSRQTGANRFPWCAPSSRATCRSRSRGPWTASRSTAIVRILTFWRPRERTASSASSPWPRDTRASTRVLRPTRPERPAIRPSWLSTVLSLFGRDVLRCIYFPSSALLLSLVSSPRFLSHTAKSKSVSVVEAFGISFQQKINFSDSWDLLNRSNRCRWANHWHARWLDNSTIKDSLFVPFVRSCSRDSSVRDQWETGKLGGHGHRNLHHAEGWLADSDRMGPQRRTNLPRLFRYIDRHQQARQLADDRRGDGESRRRVHLHGQQRRRWDEFHRDFGRERYNACSLFPKLSQSASVLSMHARHLAG